TGLSITSPFTITVNNVNEAPTVLALSGTSVTENAAGASIGTVTVTDPDAGDTHTFTLSDGRFEVVAGPLKLKAGVSLDFEAEPTVPLTITATDAGGLSVQRSFTLTVTDVAPTATFSNGGAVREGSTGLVSFSDQADPSGTDFGYSYDFDG